MKYSPGFIKRMIKIVLAGAFTFTVAACYGVVMDYRLFVNIKDPAGNPISGIKVELKQSGNTLLEASTNTGGLAVMRSVPKVQKDDGYSLLVQDIDGKENGGFFAEKEITVAIDNTRNESELTITMEPAEK